MSRYTDLTDRIIRNWHSPAVVKGIRTALRWLDSHPDQVPGRTVTGSEPTALFNNARQGLRAWEEALERTGITITPDPEPTNAEKIERLLLDLELEADAKSRKRMAEALDAEGVKAPGGDDAEKARSDAAWALSIDRQGGA